MTTILFSKKLLTVIGFIVGTEIAYYLYRKFRPISATKHEILFFSATQNNDWRLHDTEECNIKNCFCHNFVKIKAYLNSPKYTLDICLYLITSQDIASVIVEVHKKGVLVRIITDYEMSHSSGSKMEYFINAGIPVRYKQSNSLMHHKFCTFDGHTNGGLLMTGSLNFTMQAVAGNWDNLMITGQADLLRKFQEEFDRIWERFS